MYRDLTETDLPASFVAGIETLREALEAAGDEAFEAPSGDPDISGAAARERVSPAALSALIEERGPRAVVRHDRDSRHVRFKRWLKRNGHYKTGPVWEAVQTMMPTPHTSGFYWYPPGGYMGWHTNENHPGPRLYATWARDADRSFLRYRVPGSDTVLTSWDPAGWSFRWFDAGDEPETRFWHCVYSDTDRISFGFRCETEHVLTGMHTLRREWALDGFPPLEGDNHYVIRLQKLQPLVFAAAPVAIPFAEISHKRITRENYRKRSKRFRHCDPFYPGIVVEGMPNPDSRRYRMIDGKHRIHKQMDAGHTEGLFYVLRPEQVEPLIEPRY